MGKGAILGVEVRCYGGASGPQPDGLNTNSVLNVVLALVQQKILEKVGLP